MFDRGTNILHFFFVLLILFISNVSTCSWVVVEFKKSKHNICILFSYANRLWGLVSEILITSNLGDPFKTIFLSVDKGFRTVGVLLSFCLVLDTFNSAITF